MILSAIVVLVVGYIVGRLLEAVVVRILEGIGLSDYTGGSALESSGEGGGLERALGKIAAYYVYFIAILAADVLQIPILSQLLQQIGAFIPVVISAIVILVLGFIVGRVIRDIIADLIGGFNLGRYLRDTPLGRFADQEGEFGNIVGTLVAYYVYFLTLVTAANILQIGVLSGLLSRFAGYLPTLIDGLAVLIAGILIADFVGGLVVSTDGRRITDIFGVAVKIFIYYMTATLTLNTIGFATDVLTNLFDVFVVALFGSLGLAIAIGLGIGIGFGTRGYISENIDNWTSRASDTVSDESGSESGGSGSGTQSDD